MSAPRPVVLYNPRAVFYTMPLAILALGSALDRRRFTPVLVDGRLTPDPVASVLAAAEGAVALGVTVLTGAPLRDALHVTRGVKRARPDLPIVWGGWHPSLFAAECVLQEPAIDAAVAGQGERTFAELLRLLAQGEPLAGCPGTTVRAEGGSVVTGPPRPLEDLQQFPPHDYSLLEVERYFAMKGRRQLDYISSQGCRFRCSFCADPTVYARGWTGLPPERLADEAAALDARHHLEELAFQDETFFTQATRVDAVCEAFLARGLRFSWTATMRADQGARMSEADFAKARRAGLGRVIVGVESGSPQMLAWMKKDATVEQALLTAERCARHGIAATFNFIVGFPGEPPAAFDATLALVKRLRRLSPRFDTPIFTYRPYPGTPIAQAAQAAGHRFPTTLEGWADFDYVGARGPWVTPEQYRRVEALRFYARHAWGPGGSWRWPLRALSRFRCEHDLYALPLEKWLLERVRPPVALS